MLILAFLKRGHEKVDWIYALVGVLLLMIGAFRLT